MFNRKLILYSSWAINSGITTFAFYVNWQASIILSFAWGLNWFVEKKVEAMRKKQFKLNHFNIN